jgi:ribosomal protein S6--L-glutamate ligase
MKIVSFDPLRTWDMPRITRLKAEEWLKHLEAIKSADWILFPEQWQVNFLTYALKKRIFPSPGSYHLGYSKVEMTYAFQAISPEHVPYTLIVPRSDSAVEQILDEFTFPFVAKEIRNSMGRGVFLIESRHDFDQYFAYNPILYVQEFLPIERDLRVVIVGRELLTAYWRVAAPGGFYNNVARGGSIDFESVPESAVNLAVETARALDIDHAGFDIAMVDDHPYLIEFNMRFGNQALARQNIRLGVRILDYLQQKFNREGNGSNQ